MPLASIAPPASLTAGISVSNRTAEEKVPVIDWGKLLCVARVGGNLVDSPGPGEVGPETYRVVAATISTDTVLPMTATHQNYTFTLRFAGPRLRCDNRTNLGDFVSLRNPEYMVYYNATTLKSSQLWLEEMADGLDILTPKRNISCRIWNTTYAVDFSFVNGVQRTEVTGIDFLDQLGYTTKEQEDNGYTRDTIKEYGYIRIVQSD